MEGKKITWRTVNGPESGVVIGSRKKGWFVQMKSGKQMIVHPKSIIGVETAQ